MNKELTPLEAFNDLIDRLFDDFTGIRKNEWAVERQQIVEAALKRLEKIETTTHSVLREDISKELKALDIIKNNLNITEILLAVKGVCSAKEYETVKKALL